jgi:hypothetical protein
LTAGNIMEMSRKEERKFSIEEKPNKLKHEIIEELKRASTNTTGHGLPRIILSKSYFLKIMWLTFMLASIGLCAFMIVKSVSQYLNFDVNTKISVINQAQMSFPAISICNLNPLITSFGSLYLRNYYETAYNLTIPVYDVLVEYFTNNTIENVNDYLLYFTYTPKFHLPVNEFGYDAEKMLRGCEVANSFECGPFHRYYDPLYGNCFKFNGNTSHKYTINRSGEGFYIEVFAGVTDLSRDRFYAPKQKGIVVIIEDQVKFPIKTNGIIVRPGSQANIVLSKTTTENLPLPYSNCQYAEMIDTLLSREMTRLGVLYTRKNCMVFCEQKLIVDKLGCYDARLPAILNAQPCLTHNQFRNIVNLTLDFNECFPYCPFECNSIEYSVSISYGDFPTWNYYVDLTWNKFDLYAWLFQNETFNYVDFRESFAAVRIYFDELKSTDIADSPAMLVGDLIANIGGTMGLFVGVSVLSFVEIIELSINLFFIYYKKSMQKRDNQNSNL